MNIFDNQNRSKSILNSDRDSTTIIIGKLSKSISALETEFLQFKNSDSTIVKESQNLRINEVEKRLAVFENLISSNPDRALKLQEINFELKNLETTILKEKEMTEIKFTNVKEKLDQVIIWTSGLIITIIGSIIGFAFNAFKKLTLGSNGVCTFVPPALNKIVMDHSCTVGNYK